MIHPLLAGTKEVLNQINIIQAGTAVAILYPQGQPGRGEGGSKMTTQTVGGVSGRGGMRMGVLSLALIGLMLTVQPVRAGTVTGDNLNDSIAAATTAADHEAIAAYYQSKATEALSQAESHKVMEKTYKRWGSGKEQMYHNFHCKGLIRSYENLAKSYETLAKEHAEMAKKVK